MGRDSTADALHGTQEGAALRQRARLGKVGGGDVFAERGQVRESRTAWAAPYIGLSPVPPARHSLIN